MENYESNKMRRTVTGSLWRYDIEEIDGPGHVPWWQVSVSEGGARSHSFYLPVEDFKAISRALYGSECEQPNVQQGRRKRPLSEAVGQLYYRNAGQPWSAGEDALLAYLFLEGHSPFEMMMLLGRSHICIPERLTQLGFTPEWPVPRYDNLRAPLG